MHNCWA